MEASKMNVESDVVAHASKSQALRKRKSGGLWFKTSPGKN
jgi:hypothetical protein